MKKPISASSAIACRWRISALRLAREDAVDDLLEAVRADVVLVRPGPAVYEDRRLSGDTAGLSLLAARLDAARVPRALQAGIVLVPIQAEPAGEATEEAGRVARAPTPLALREEERVRHRPELPLLAGALRRQGRNARPRKPSEREVAQPPPYLSGRDKLFADGRQLQHREFAAVRALEVGVLDHLDRRRLAAQRVPPKAVRRRWHQAARGRRGGWCRARRPHQPTAANNDHEAEQRIEGLHASGSLRQGPSSSPGSSRSSSRKRRSASSTMRRLSAISGVS